MSLALLTRPPWSSPPSSKAATAERMAWYVAVARWAPSKHNSQPWRFVVRPGSLELWADPERMLPSTDPHRRELVVSCGVALQHVSVAARALGFRVQAVYLPDGAGDLLARIAEVGPWQTTDRDRLMLDLIPRRRTDRGPLDATGLPASTPFLLHAAAAGEGGALRLVATPGDRATLVSLVERADRLLVREGAFDRELVPWLRAEQDPRQDGVRTDRTRGAAASYRAEFVQRDFSSPGSTPTHDRDGVDQPLLGIVCTTGDRVADWLTGGRALGAVLLAAALEGADASYLNQPMEVPASRHELRTAFGLGGFPQVVLRLGRGGDVPPTSRRDLEDLISG